MAARRMARAAPPVDAARPAPHPRRMAPPPLLILQDIRLRLGTTWLLEPKGARGRPEPRVIL